ncbi:MAG: lysophospholipid acyltransferase family protein [Candidatus Micropelagos thuwalensis]
MKQTIKTILRSTPVLYFLATLLKIWVGFIYLSCRKTIIGQQHANTLQNINDTFIITIWHRSLLLAPKTLLKSKSYASLSSNHSDGKIGVIYAKLTGVTPITGSGTGTASKRPFKDKKGAAALRTILRYLGNNKSVWLTADIPPGPIFECGRGIIAMAQLSQKPILATAIRTKNEIIIEKAWDKLIIPKPFGKMVIAYGEPLWVPRDADKATLEACRLQLEKNLNELNEKAENLLKG